MIPCMLGAHQGGPRVEEGQSSKAVRLRFVALLVRSWLQLVGSDAVRLQRVRFEPVRWLRIAYPAGELLPGWLSARGAPGRQSPDPFHPRAGRTGFLPPLPASSGPPPLARLRWPASAGLGLKGKRRGLAAAVGCVSHCR